MIEKEGGVEAKMEDEWRKRWGVDLKGFVVDEEEGCTLIDFGSVCVANSRAPFFGTVMFASQDILNQAPSMTSPNKQNIYYYSYSDIVSFVKYCGYLTGSSRTATQLLTVNRHLSLQSQVTSFRDVWRFYDVECKLRQFRPLFLLSYPQLILYVPSESPPVGPPCKDMWSFLTAKENRALAEILVRDVYMGSATQRTRLPNEMLSISPSPVLESHIISAHSPHSSSSSQSASSPSFSPSAFPSSSPCVGSAHPYPALRNILLHPVRLPHQIRLPRYAENLLAIAFPHPLRPLLSYYSQHIQPSSSYPIGEDGSKLVELAAQYRIDPKSVIITDEHKVTNHSLLSKWLVVSSLWSDSFLRMCAYSEWSSLLTALYRRRVFVGSLIEMVKGFPGRWPYAPSSFSVLVQDVLRTHHLTAYRRTDYVKEFGWSMADDRANREELNHRGEDEMNRREADVEHREESVARREAELKRQAANLEHERINMKRREDDVRCREDTISQREDDLLQREDYLLQRDDNLIQREESMIQREISLKQQTEKLEEQMRIFEMRVASMKEWEEKLKERELALQQHEALSAARTNSN